MSPDLLRANMLPRLWKYGEDWINGLGALVITKPLIEYKSIFSTQFLGKILCIILCIYVLGIIDFW